MKRTKIENKNKNKNPVAYWSFLSPVFVIQIKGYEYEIDQKCLKKLLDSHKEKHNVR